MNGFTWAAGLNGLLLETCVVVAVVFAVGIVTGWLLRSLYGDEELR